MHPTDLLGILQQIEMAWTALFQSTTGFLKALAGLILAAALVLTAITQLRDQLRKKRKALRGKKVAPKHATSTNVPSARQQAGTVRRGSQTSSVSDNQSQSQPVLGSSSSPSVPKDIIQMPLAHLQAPVVSRTQSPHVEPVMPRTGNGSSDDANVEISQAEVDSELSNQPTRPTPHNRPVRRVEFVDIFPGHPEHPDRKATRDALNAVSNLVKIAFEMRDAAHQQTRSLKFFARHLQFLSTLSDALSKLYKQASNLDNAIEALKLTWDRDDPRSVLFTYLDPFALSDSPRSPDDMRRVFKQEAERVATAIENNIGPIVQRMNETSPNGEWISYKLAPPSTE